MMHQPEQNPGTNMHQNMHQNALSLLILIDLELLPAFGCGARIGVGVLRDCPIGLFPLPFHLTPRKVTQFSRTGRAELHIRLWTTDVCHRARF